MARLARSLLRLAYFFVLIYLFAHIINPESFISVDTTSAFSRWIYGDSNQENFEDLWVLVWFIGSLLAAAVTYCLTMFIIKKVRQ